MGNSSSQHQQTPGHQWTHSYPRQRHLQPQVKVLPEQVPPLRLRTTDNGAILQNGGTISARKHSFGPEGRVYRPRSSSAHRAPNLDEINLDKTRFGSEPDLRFHLKESRDQFSDNAVRQRISRSRKKYKAPPAPHNAINNGMESSSSEINSWELNSKDCNSGAGRKARLFKTRAETNKKNSIATHRLEIMDSEMSRSTEALNVTKSKFKEERLDQSLGIDKDRNERPEKKGLKRSASHEVISMRKSLATPEFHAELMEAAQKMRSSAMYSNKISPKLKKKNSLKSSVETRLKENTSSNRSAKLANANDIKLGTKTTQVFGQEDSTNKNNKSEFRSGFENLSKVTVGHVKNKQERDVPSKKFYFGMEENNNEVKIVNNNESTNNVDKTNAAHRMTAVEKSKNLMNLYKSVADVAPDWEETVDKFAANFHKSQVVVTNGNTTSCSSSFVSDPDEDVVGGIALQLRPTLPKKQLEIPRFSPTAAWRLLSSLDPVSSQPFFPGENDDGPLLLEDRIHPPGPQPGLRSSHDKSGDSGISGDASPGGCHESSSELMTPAKTVPAPKNVLVAWTPQQDLEEESSSDDLESPLNSSKTVGSRIPGAKFSPRGQLFLSRDQSFSLSVPREDPLCLYAENFDSKERSNSELTPRLNSLTKLKTALAVSKRNEGLEDNAHSQNDNWVLSKSVPSSLNNSHIAVTRSMSNPSSPEQDEESNQTSLKYPSYSYLAKGGRMMYLPEYHSRMSPNVSVKKPKTNMFNNFLSKSCENIMEAEMRQLRRSRSPSPHRLPVDSGSMNQKKKKFTFQSTVRLIENRRLAEKLSREAELKENQRLTEVEAMRKVEEEFQKKRAREKANIRQQLRLFSLEEKNYNSLPPCDWEENSGDMEGGPCSLPPRSNYSNKKNNGQNKKAPGLNELNKLASTTQVLSEYREPTRDYRDYRQSRCQDLQELPMETGKRSVVEHPRMVYDMPKNTAVYVSAPVNSFVQSHGREENRSSSSDNYRKDFAQGALAAGGRSLTSSDSELSQSQPRSASRQGLTPRRYNVIRRSRSASSESLSPSNSPQRYRKRSSGSLSRSRSVSPSMNLLDDVSVSGSQEGKSVEKKLPVRFTSTKKLSVSLERKLSNPNDYRTSNKRQNENELNADLKKQDAFDKRKTSTLVRLGLPSLQPFEKTEKSFRPINFNPVINKLAQTVN